MWHIYMVFTVLMNLIKKCLKVKRMNWRSFPRWPNDILISVPFGGRLISFSSCFRGWFFAPVRFRPIICNLIPVGATHFSTLTWISVLPLCCPHLPKTMDRHTECYTGYYGCNQDKAIIQYVYQSHTRSSHYKAYKT